MEIKKCIICYKTTAAPGGDKASVKIAKLKKDTVLNRQLIVIFLLRKFFKTPQYLCKQLLEEYGNPSEWVNWCESCSFLVKRAKCVFDQIILLRKQFDALQEELKTTVQLSESNPQIPEARIPDNFKWGATEMIRECLTKLQSGVGDYEVENSNTIIECKAEIAEEEFNTFEFGDQRSLFVDENDITFEQTQIDPLDIDLEIPVSELPTDRQKRFSNRLVPKSISGILQKSRPVLEDGDNSNQSFDLTTQENFSDSDDPVENVPKNAKISFQCEKCLRYYKSVYYLKEHFVNAHGELPISCDTCNEKMINESELMKHKERFHKMTHTVSCPKCPTKTFLNQITLKQHCRKEHSEEFENMFLRKRAKKRYASLENSISCKKCGKIFVHLGSLRVHCRRYHLEDYSELFKDIRRDTCDKCGAKFARRTQLKSHYEKEHPKDFKLRYYEQNAKYLSCPHCLYKTFKDEYLQMHMKKHNQQLANTVNEQNNKSDVIEESTIKCEVQTENSMFISEDTLDNIPSVSRSCRSPLDMESNSSSRPQQLMRTPSEHDNQNPSTDEDSNYSDLPEEENVSSDESYNPAQQRTSPRKFKNKQLWKKNDRSGNLPCPKCTNRTFMSEKSLKAHYRKEHSEVFEQMFPLNRSKRRISSFENSVSCQKCGNLFVCVKSLKSHCRNYHAEDYSKMFSEADKNSCDKCKEKFRNRRELKLHYEKEHPDYYNIKYYDKNYKSCPHCLFKTYSEKYLQVHISKHGNKMSQIVDKLPTGDESNSASLWPECSQSTQLSINENSTASEIIGNDETESQGATEPNENPSSLHVGKRGMKNLKANKPFKCEICSYSYTTIYGLKEHYLNFHGELPINCDKCGAGLANDCHLKLHTEKYHNEANTASCPKCITRTFRNEKCLRMHCKREHPDEYDKMLPPTRITRSAATQEDSIACEKCEAKFVSLKSLKCHGRKYHPESFPQMFEKSNSKTCENCNKTFNSRRDLKIHYEKEHPREFKLRYYPEMNKKLYPCPHCPYKGPKNYIQDHINIHLNLRPYICDLCGVAFKNARVLGAHQRSKHHEELGLEPLKCEHCGKMFESPAYLQTHIKSAHLGQFKYHCHICNRGFSYPSYLRIHLQRHKGERPNLCEECGKTFLRPAELKKHIRAVHENERPFPCRKCSKTFCSRQRLKRHEQGVHSDGTKPYECKICQKRFPVRNYLYIHMRSHSKRGEVVEGGGL